MKYFFAFLLSLVSIIVFAAKPKDSYVKINVLENDVYLKLYNETPKHKANFIKIVKEGKLNGTLFHRVIKDFMIQGGDIDSKNAKPNQFLGNGDLGYTIPAEFNSSLIHKKGALAAARTNNPKKASSSCQFYIVQGQKFDEQALARIEKSKTITYTAAQKEIYTSIGGTPHLDNEYTVFGEVVKGLDVIDKIADYPTDGNNRPKEDIRMRISVLKKKEIKKLIKDLNPKIKK